MLVERFMGRGSAGSTNYRYYCLKISTVFISKTATKDGQDNKAR